MRGMEEWEMMMDCAKSLREQAYHALRLSRGRSQHEHEYEHEMCLLPFLDIIMNGVVQKSVLGKRRKGAGREEMSPVKHERGGSKKARKTTRVGRGVSQFWAEDDGTAKTNRRRPRGQQEISVSGDGERAVKHYEPNQQDEKATLSARLSTVVHRPVESVEGKAESEEKESRSKTEDADLEHSPPPDATSHHDAQTPQYSLASSSSPDGILDAAFGDVPVAGRLNLGAPLVPATTRITGKRTYKSPFFSEPPPSSKSPSKTSPSKTKSPTKKSQNLPPGISRLPIPPLSAPSFGLIQEELASDPFRLLIAVTFLIKVRGALSIPLFRQLMARFPTPEALAAADPDEIINLIRPLGLSVNRTAVIRKYARMWIECPPCKEKRYGVKNYPRPWDGKGVKVGEEFGAEPDDFYSHIRKVTQGGGKEDAEDIDAIKLAKEHAIGSAWEIGHLTQGPYALDSWRIFCRDKLLGRAEDWKGKGRHPEFQPEWMRVLPRDKELRACLRWMW